MIILPESAQRAAARAVLGQPAVELMFARDRARAVLVSFGKTEAEANEIIEAELNEAAAAYKRMIPDKGIKSIIDIMVVPMKPNEKAPTEAATSETGADPKIQFDNITRDNGCQQP